MNIYHNANHILTMGGPSQPILLVLIAAGYPSFGGVAKTAFVCKIGRLATPTQINCHPSRDITNKKEGK